MISVLIHNIIATRCTNANAVRTRGAEINIVNSR